MRAENRQIAAYILALMLGIGAVAFSPDSAQAKVIKRDAARSRTSQTEVVQAERVPEHGEGEGSAVSGSGVIVAGAGTGGGNTVKIQSGSEAAEGIGVVTGQGAVMPPKDRKVVTTTLFDGGELMLIAPQTVGQMESFILTTKSGKIIVVDGGTEGDAPHLKQLLMEKGGRVSAWFITHPHSDHVGAMTKLIEEGDPALTIENIYYNFPPLDWCRRNEAYRADMVERCLNALAKRDPASNHDQIGRGDTIQIDDVTVHVLNTPYRFPINAINNASVVYRVEMNGKRILFLGDLGVQGGNRLVEEYRDDPGALKADIVQMAHHGQSGVDRNVYELVRPGIALWCCPRWLWDNDNGGGVNSGNWKTLEVRSWMRQLNVKTHVVAKDGDQVLR